MAALASETSIRDGIVRWLTAYGVFAWTNDTVGIYDAKRGSFRTNRKRLKGVADILGIREGRFLAIEVKRGRNKCSEAQQYFLGRVRTEGGIGIVARCIRDVQDGLVAAEVLIDKGRS